MCIVEIEGENEPVCSCSTAVADGLVVTTDSKPLHEQRTANLKKILPADAALIWITATECGRPVVADQSYRVKSPSLKPLVIDIAGGCGLGGNTPVIPQVQKTLEKRHPI